MRKKRTKMSKKCKKLTKTLHSWANEDFSHLIFKDKRALCAAYNLHFLSFGICLEVVSHFRCHLRRHSENLLPFYFSYLYFDWHIWTMWTRYLSNMPQWICVFRTYSMGVRAMCIRWCGFVSVATPNPFFLISLPKPWQTIAKKCGT